jgi:predicted sulfurtransferase
VLPFNHMKVRISVKIVTMGQPGCGPTASVGHMFWWNELIASTDVAVIDTHNDYEV